MADIMKELTYYCRGEDNRPMVTVMLLVDSKGNIARGYAICSDLETPVISENVQMRNGPGLARKRAMKAYKTKTDDFYIERSEPVQILSRVAGGEDLLRVSRSCKANFIQHSAGQRHLTAYEQKLLKSNGLK